MSLLRTLSASTLSAITTFGIVTASGCGTDAVGIDECRDIEQARCRAGAFCGLVEDAAACERYYRDHCLHGLASEPPAGASTAECVKVIEAAGRCAEANAEAALADCDEPVTAPRPGLRTVCDVIEHPERASECAFLTDVPDESTGGQPGSSSADEEPGATAGASTGGDSGAQAGSAAQ